MQLKEEARILVNKASLKEMEDNLAKRALVDLYEHLSSTYKKKKDGLTLQDILRQEMDIGDYQQLTKP